ASASGFAQVTLSMKEVTLQEVFKEIQQQSGYDFLYTHELLSRVGKVSVKARGLSLERVMELCLKDTPLTYVIVDHAVIVKQKEVAPRDPQDRALVSGKVTDTSGEPLPGVTVSVKGETLGSTTNAEGLYRLYLPARDKVTLRFTFIGMEAQEVEYAGQETINIVMRESVSTLDDVVVTGIFNKARESYTGAATRVTGKELKAYRGQNLLATLRNIDPSINIVVDNNLGSNPNVVPEVTIRGNSSLPQSLNELNAGASKQLNAPLVIMDGFQISLQKLMDFDDEGIESITLLKDAAATAIYGSRGANGVIVVATRAPRAGKLRFFAQGGINLEIPDLSSYDLLNAREKLELELASNLYDMVYDYSWQEDIGKKEQHSRLYADMLAGVNTDWLSQPLQTGVGQRYNLRIEGGASEFRWGASIAYNKVKGAMKGSARDAFSGALTLSYTFDNLIFRDQLIIDANKGTESKYGTFSEYARMNPYWRIKDDEGNYIKSYPSPYYNSPIKNPLYDAQLNTINQQKYTTITNNFAIEWNIADALTLRGQLGIAKQFNTSDYYLPPDHTNFENNSTNDFFRKGSYTYGTGEEFNVDGNVTLSYSRLFADKHQLYVGLDYSIAHRESFGYEIQVEGFSGERLNFFANALQYAQGTKPAGEESISRRVGFTGNVNYTYDNRYYADFSFRQDGSSQFGAKKRFAPFWSAGLGWNVHREGFLKESKLINNLRLRASYGETGSQQFYPYQALSTFQYYNSQRYLAWNGARLMALGNENLQWQVTHQWNGGFEAGLWNGRLSASLDVYVKTTSNLVSQMDITPSHGFPSYADNVGEVQNKGYEAALGGHVLRDADGGLSWLLTAKLAYNDSKVTRLSQALKDQVEAEKLKDVEINNLLYEGYPQRGIWAVPSLGIDPSTGSELFLDRDGEITDDWHPSAKRYFGVSEPPYRGNLGSLLTWGDLSLNLSFAYHWGGQQYNETLLRKVEVSFSQLQFNVDRRAYTERWQNEGDVKRFKRYDRRLPDTKSSSRFVMDDNVFELQSANLQYRWRPAFLRERWDVEALNISLNMSDVFYISSVKRERGIAYPFARRMSLAFSFMF
ncbi:MAG: SusC/RagA family TonB-linked outer membrane protein, partial [Odoribacteraceae bacterium]|nr:SusC/RagA family TonB-linked outer membrane protein [Odoribacteraceae bacterium]